MQTEKKLMKVPLGIQTFEHIREDNYVYVDKTRFLVDMIDRGKIYFSARPRCFGTSLTISTLDAMFSGKKHLFKGLYAEEFMNRADYHASPIIRIDMCGITTNKGVDVMKASLNWRISEIADRFGIKIPEDYCPGEALSYLTRNLAETRGQVVILIDEYDKPYTDFYGDHEMAEKIRKVLLNFYKYIQSDDEYTRFVFIAGVVKLGVFWEVLSPNDISSDERYGEMYGFTEEEVALHFSEHFAEIATESGCSTGELLEKIRDYYYGFCFDGVHRLYNPYTILYFLRDGKFMHFWVQSGSSKEVANYLRANKLTVEQFRKYIVSGSFVRNPGEPDDTTPAGFLYQAGYLSICEKFIDYYDSHYVGSHYVFDYPNKEVLYAMSSLLIQSILPVEDSFWDLWRFTTCALKARKVKELIETFNIVLANIPYDDFAKAGPLGVALLDCDMSVREWIYRSSILALLRGCEVVPVAEMETNLGRADLVIEYVGNTFVVELKVAYKSEDVPAKLAEAVNLMREKNYLAPYPGATGLALVIDDEKRQITASEEFV